MGSPLTTKTTTEGGNAGVVAVDAPRETNGTDPQPKKIQAGGGCPFADRVLEQRAFGDDALGQARAALEEALRLAPDDSDGGIHGRLGRVQFLQERYEEAQSNLAIARERDRGNHQWAQPLERAMG